MDLKRVALAAVVLVGCTQEHSRWRSPDGLYEVIVRSEIRLVAMPGGGSDAPATINVVRLADGVSCGTAPVDMAWMARELAWRPGVAELQMTARWDLRTCTVTELPR